MPLQCRTCGSVIYNSKAANLFDAQNNNILDAIALLTGIELINVPGLPDCICVCCHLDLNQFTIFRERCINTQNRLQNFINGVDTLETSEAFEDYAEENVIELETDINHQDETDAQNFITDDVEDDMNEVKELFGLSDNDKEYIIVDNDKNVDGEDCDSLISNLKKELYRPYDEDVEVEQVDFQDNSDNSNSPSTMSSPYTPSLVENLPTASKSTTFYAKSRKGTISHLNETLSCKLKTYEESGRIGPNGKKKYISWKNMSEEEIIERKRASRRRECVCDQCGKHFTDVSNFKLHMLRHTGNKEYSCDDCGMRFYTEHLLSLHCRTRHLGERPYKCKYCQKTFSNSTTRAIHERGVHTKIRPYKCSYCNKRFNAASGVKRHELIHTGIRKYECTICDQRFQRSTHLRAHFRSQQHRLREDCATNDIIVEYE